MLFCRKRQDGGPFQAAQQVVRDEQPTVAKAEHVLLVVVSPLGDEELSRMRTKVETSLKSVRKSADRQVRQALDVSSRAARATDDYVRESPWKAVGIAAIAALAVSSLVMSRREN